MRAVANSFKLAASRCKDLPNGLKWRASDMWYLGAERSPDINPGSLACLSSA